MANEIIYQQLFFFSLSYDLTRRSLPDISSGCSMPMAARTVGATSPRTPSSPFLRLHPSGALAKMKGTLLVVWEVLGVPFALIISSAFLHIQLVGSCHSFKISRLGENEVLTHGLQ